MQQKHLSGKDLALWQLLRHGCLSGSGFIKKNTCDFQVAPILMLQTIILDSSYSDFMFLVGLELRFFLLWFSKQNTGLIDLDPKSCLGQ